MLKSRIAGEYDAPIELEPIPYQTARWVSADERAGAGELQGGEPLGSLAEDRDGRLVFLARNAWELDNIAKRFPQITLRDTRELTAD